MPRYLSLHTASALPPAAEQGLGRAPESIAGDPGCRGLPRGPKKTQRQLRLRMDTEDELDICIQNFCIKLEQSLQSYQAFNKPSFFHYILHYLVPFLRDTVQLLRRILQVY